jgi:hypothetical protein
VRPDRPECSVRDSCYLIVPKEPSQPQREIIATKELPETLREFLSSSCGNSRFFCRDFSRICRRTAERLRRNHRIYERSLNGLKRRLLSEDFNYESPRQVETYYSSTFFECVILLYIYKHSYIRDRLGQ